MIVTYKLNTSYKCNPQAVIILKRETEGSSRLKRSCETLYKELFEKNVICKICKYHSFIRTYIRVGSLDSKLQTKNIRMYPLLSSFYNLITTISSELSNVQYPIHLNILYTSKGFLLQNSKSGTMDIILYCDIPEVIKIIKIGIIREGMPTTILHVSHLNYLKDFIRLSIEGKIQIRKVNIYSLAGPSRRRAKSRLKQYLNELGYQYEECVIQKDRQRILHLSVDLI